MCEPVTILTALSVAVGAAGAIQQSQAAAGQASYQAAVNRNNAVLSEKAARDATERGELEEKQSRLRTSQMIGSQRAGFAANGVVIDEGSALDVTADTAILGEQDALTIRDNASREAFNHRAQGAQFSSSAGMFETSASNAETAGFLNAGASVLGGVQTVAPKWYNYKKAAA